MADQILATYEPATARMILDTVRYLKQSGFVIPDGQKRAGIFTQPPLYVQNESGEEIPAYACMQSVDVVVDGSDPELTRIKVDKPVDVDGNAGVYLFNSSSPIPVGQGGIAYAGPIVRALTEGSAITHAASWGPSEGEWAIAPGGSFRILGADAIGTRVARVLVGSVTGSGCRLFVARLSGPWVSLISPDAQIYSIDGQTLTATETAHVYDPLAIFGATTTGHYLLVIRQDGKHYAINAPCPT